MDLFLFFTGCLLESALAVVTVLIVDFCCWFGFISLKQREDIENMRPSEICRPERYNYVPS